MSTKIVRVVDEVYDSEITLPICELADKTRYASYRQAMHFARLMKYDESASAYPCYACRGYHLTRQPEGEREQWVREMMPADDLGDVVEAIRSKKSVPLGSDRVGNSRVSIHYFNGYVVAYCPKNKMSPILDILFIDEPDKEEWYKNIISLRSLIVNGHSVPSERLSDGGELHYCILGEAVYEVVYYEDILNFVESVQVQDIFSTKIMIEKYVESRRKETG